MHNSNCDKPGETNSSGVRAAGHKNPETKTCFAAGTLVHTKDGLKPIEDIQAGDWVLSHPEEGSWQRDPTQEGANTYRQVTNTFAHDDQPILRVTYVQPGGEKVTEPLRVTANHLIMKKGTGWTSAGELQIGDMSLIGYYGNAMVTKVRDLDEKVRVHNFDVEEFHTYFVEKLGVWVHNKTELPVAR